MQDFLSLDSDARMNLPGVLGGNWSWRMPASVFEDQVLIERMTDLNHLYYRSPGIDDIPLQGHI
jgi:4-alpha-glucanotransferase